MLSRLISQNNLLRPLVKRRPQETDFGSKLKSWDNVLTFGETFGEIGTPNHCTTPTNTPFKSGPLSDLHGSVYHKTRKIFGPVKPFLVHLKTERCIVCA